MEQIKSILGKIKISGETVNWQISARTESPEQGLEFIHLKLSSPEPAMLPPLSLKWNVPLLDMTARWCPDAKYDRHIPPNWGKALSSMLTASIPLVQLINLKDENRMLIAVSDAKRKVDIKCGVMEESSEIHSCIQLFSEPEAPISQCRLSIRLDVRRIFYADAIRSAMDWFAEIPEYMSVPVPDAAFDPLYSTWYGFHQNLFAGELEKECALAGEYGLKGIIVDDGWQTDDNNRGYAFCGDWEISKNRFPDMRGHVEKIHELGMKYLVWFGIPLIGGKSKNRHRFSTKILYRMSHKDVGILDPRFPEVRDYLISTCEKAIKEWDIDGLKLDFIELFRFENEDPAVRENYAGRDIKSLPDAVDSFLSELMARLKKIKPDILIEFRQNYIGPAIRKYCTMLRSSDCPCDALTNRINTIDLRLTSGNTAVHSDMLEWNFRDTAENTALQILNILFCVPQISVRFSELPESHRMMLHFWMDFWMEHRDTLLNGHLKPCRPDLNYPIVSAKNIKETIIAVYDFNQRVMIDCEKEETCFVVNATGCSDLILEIRRKPITAECFDTMGNPVPFPVPEAGLVCTNIPESGLLKLTF